jgi:hypothetical protein
LNSSMSDSAPAAVLANAVYIPAVNPVKVMAYTRGASPGGVAKVNALINSVGSARGRSVSITEAKTVAAVTNDLNVMDYQVLLVHDLDQATPGDLALTAQTWEDTSTITSFSKAGGVVIVLSGSDGTGEMHEFISAANLLEVAGQTDITDPMASIYNNAPADVLGVNVLHKFAPTSHTCTFQTSVVADANHIFVVTDEDPGLGDGEPVVIHRVVRPD